MKLNHPLLIKTAGLVMTGVIRRWMDTLDYRWALYDQSVDPALDVPGCRRIYLFWHEYVLLPLDRRRHCNITMLLSRHHDGNLVSQVARHQGYGVVRGSTFDGGSASIRELVHSARHSHLTITPDGPRGPRRVMAVGPIYLAARLGMPIVPIGFGYDRPWRANSWDRFAVPRPFSRARCIMGPEMCLPKKLDRDGLEHYRVEVQRMMNYLTLEAEAWAEAGTPKVGDLPIRVEVRRRGNHPPPKAAELAAAAKRSAA